MSISMRPWIPLLLVSLSAGCQWSDEVTIVTKVYPDGSFDRRIVFQPVGRKESFHKRFIVPSGINWEVSESGPDEKTYRYEASGHFEGLASDYAKLDDKTPPQVSRNAIEIGARDGDCTYRETFQDTVDKVRLLEAYDRLRRASTQAVMRHLATTLFQEERPDMVQRITQGVTQAMLGWQDQLWKLYEDITDQDTHHLAAGWLQTETDFLINQIDRWWKEEGAFYPRENAVTRIQEALSAWQASPADDEAMTPFEEKIKQYNGAYGSWGIGDLTGFEVSVEMPAAIRRSNAHTVEGHRATWSFSPMYFWLKDYTLEAASPCVS